MNEPHPALNAFLSAMGEEFLLAQVLLRRDGGGFELRHVEDREAAPESLREVPPDALRALAAQTADGAFRPLKAAPNLQRGWRAQAGTPDELALALDQLYPGALADMRAAQADPPPVTPYREFTARQSGMYRITTMLDDAQAAVMIRAGCHARFCLKRRLWSVTGLAPDAPEAKSVIPCLEPCAVLLEFARKAARLEQAESLPLTVEEATTVIAALEATLAATPADTREADFGAPLNPRRVQLLIEKLRPRLTAPDAQRAGE